DLRQEHLYQMPGRWGPSHFPLGHSLAVPGGGQNPWLRAARMTLTGSVPRASPDTCVPSSLLRPQPAKLMEPYGRVLAEVGAGWSVPSETGGFDSMSATRPRTPQACDQRM